ncbi:probable tRNA N6-adenosine threonylcarbamoyltransferase, mitochondrial [Pararge aegeria]|uniref:N(6)-L-threonylcarbamoyladenine synthase n=2 Tax=Pararge aegeria TaxID=116150 RepID=A0A8S4R7R4_9NEOP|nr:probable tRNA N6-adenosine threonylcarbamoyltransferase, mitochondrial [Pararge aegeria]CAH2230519.1 jg18621 [Pararge aegeria aegeria]
MLCLKYIYRITKKRSRIYPIEKKYLSTVLGIETSCDDTGCAVLDEKGNILGESLYSQNLFHLRCGGVNPVIARDLHRDNIDLAVNEALDMAKLSLKDIDAIAVTVKPGLLISLQIGVKYAMYHARTHNKLLIPIHHMEAHALVARMYYNISFPFLTLLISGGNSMLALVKNVDDFLLLGDTLDNAPGEILDKAARRMKLRNIPAYSKLAGGQSIEMAARHSINPYLFKFPLPLARNRDCSFSFSGLKDALMQHLLRKEKEHGIVGDGLIPEVNDLCAGFQLAIAEHLGHRTERAVVFCEENNLLDRNHKSIVVSGGVACNDFIFKGIQLIGDKLGCNVYRPPPKVCTDNGIMIAWNGIEKLKKRSNFENITLKDVDPSAPLGTNIIDKVKTANIHVRITRIKI